MQLSSPPQKIPLAFATDGTKNTIPEAASSTPGQASLAAGFPPETMEPITAGGVPPSGKDMNGILFLESALSRWYSAGGSFKYDNAFATDTNVGGYPEGAVVLNAAADGFWVSLADNNTDNPDTGSSLWVPFFSYGITPIAMTSANVTMAAAQYAKSIIVLSGIMTTNLNLIFPTTKQAWTVVNNCTGGFKVTCKTASGTGVDILQGFTAQVYGDGTNINQALAAASGVIGTMTNAAIGVTAASTAATFTADQVIVGNAVGAPVTILGPVSDSIDISTTGIGGMDTGAAPVSGYVAIYLVSGPAGVGLLGVDATSAAAPVIYGNGHMPAGYLQSALVSVWPTDGTGKLVAGQQLGRTIYISPVTVVSTTTTTNNTSVSIAAAVPKNAKVFGGAFIVEATSSQPTTFSYFAIGPLGVNGPLGAQTFWNYGQATGNLAQESVFSGVPIVTPQLTYYGLVVNSGAGTLASNSGFNISSYSF